MGTLTTILIAVLVFGGLIFIHEFGHYITARMFKVTITEFSIGMGPRLVSYDSKKTGIRYSLAMFPFGGFVSMPGESVTLFRAVQPWKAPSARLFSLRGISMLVSEVQPAKA